MYLLQYTYATVSALARRSQSNSGICLQQSFPQNSHYTFHFGSRLINSGLLKYSEGGQKKRHAEVADSGSARRLKSDTAVAVAT